MEKLIGTLEDLLDSAASDLRFNDLKEGSYNFFYWALGVNEMASCVGMNPIGDFLLEVSKIKLSEHPEIEDEYDFREYLEEEFYKKSKENLWVLDYPKAFQESDNFEFKEEYYKLAALLKENSIKWNFDFTEEVGDWFLIDTPNGAVKVLVHYEDFGGNGLIEIWDGWRQHPDNWLPAKEAFEEIKKQMERGK